MTHKPKDRRYDRVRVLIEARHIKKFDEIFLHLPRSIVMRDMGFNYHYFQRSLKDPHRFTLAKLVHLSNLIGIDPMIILKMAYLK